MNDAVAALRCPHCGSGLRRTTGGVACTAGHTFDAARQGYLHLGGGRTPSGDDADMLASRTEVFAAGVFEPLSRRVVGLVEQLSTSRTPAEGTILDVGAGPGVYLARVLDALPASVGIALDASKYAARRAAKAHPRITAVVADVWSGLPVADRSISVLLDVFAPRNGAEFARVVRDDGRLLVVTPRPDHLAELRRPLGLLAVDPDKAERLDAELGDAFCRDHTEVVRWDIVVSRPIAVSIACMGPSARHGATAAAEFAAHRLGDTVNVTASVDLAVYRPRARRDVAGAAPQPPRVTAEDRG